MHLSAVGGVFAGVVFLADLPEGSFGRAVELELKDVDVLRGFHHAVHAALALLLFGEHEVGADEAQQEVERVVEIAFLLALAVLAAHGVGDAGEESGELVAECFSVASFEGNNRHSDPTFGLLLWLEIIVGQHGYKSSLHFIVGEIQHEEFQIGIVVFNGEIAALINPLLKFRI